MAGPFVTMSKRKNIRFISAFSSERKKHAQGFNVFDGGQAGAALSLVGTPELKRMLDAIDLPPAPLTPPCPSP